MGKKAAGEVGIDAKIHDWLAKYPEEQEEVWKFILERAESCDKHSAYTTSLGFIPASRNSMEVFSLELMCNWLVKQNATLTRRCVGNMRLPDGVQKGKEPAQAALLVAYATQVPYNLRKVPKRIEHFYHMLDLRYEMFGQRLHDLDVVDWNWNQAGAYSLEHNEGGTVVVHSSSGVARALGGTYLEAEIEFNWSDTEAKIKNAGTNQVWEARVLFKGAHEVLHFHEQYREQSGFNAQVLEVFGQSYDIATGAVVEKTTPEKLRSMSSFRRSQSEEELPQMAAEFLGEIEKQKPVFQGTVQHSGVKRLLALQDKISAVPAKKRVYF
mmetsp:Transcript_26732/g.49066  ORF Transcript_26732/g.49066 Transcript_26732/m.49066 type:complete len:325 (+) Transcript_26732:82-1056(+)